MDKANYKYLLVFAVFVTGFLDALTFFLFNLKQFEANPIYILTKSVSFLILYKFLVLIGLAYLIIKYKPKKALIWAYAICFLSIYVILGQLLGAYMNISTYKEVSTHEAGEIVPLEPTKAVTQYSLIFGLLLYLPMFLALVSFWIFERIYL